MRPGQQNKRGRGRNNNNGGGGGGNFNRKGANPLTRTYDSSGPDVKIRGTAQHIAEKYSALARDAQSSGDRVMAENYLQHAEHYNRIIAAAQAQMQDRFQRDDREERNDFNDRDFNDRDEDMDGADEVHSNHQPSPQPAPAPVQAANNPVREPRPQREPREPREPREHREPREPKVAAEQRPAPVIAGTGPQPVIEDIPVAAAAPESTEEQPTERQPRRRNAAPRPRRQPRRANGSAEAGEEGPKGAEDGGDQAAAEPAVLATVSE